MFRSPRVWLYAAGGWLILAGLTHGGLHVWSFVLERGIDIQQEFAVTAMKQSFSPDPLRPSLWREMRMLSVSFGLFLVFAGFVPVSLAWIDAPGRTVRTIALFGTLFWTVTFGLYAFLDPVLGPLLIAACAVPLHALAWLTAQQQEAPFDD